MARVEIKGRKAVITGAGRGLGRALALVLADAGAELVICGRDPAKLIDVAGTIAARGLPRPECITLDLADRASVDAAVNRIVRSAQPPDILINNGAKWLAGSLESNTPEEIAETVASQLTGTILFTAGAAAAVKTVYACGCFNDRIDQRLAERTIVRTPSPAFHAAKHGQAGFANGLRQALIGTRIRATAIYPPNIEDIQPDDPVWDGTSRRPKESTITNRDVVEAVIFVLTRPKHVTIADLVLDADVGGFYA